MIRLLSAVFLAALTGACAIGHQYDYRSGTPAITAEGTRSVAVAVSDQRSYVLSSDKPATFIGLKRGGYGNPFDVTTVSGAPLASDMTEMIVRALIARGYDARALPLAPGAGPGDGAPNADRLLYIAMREWKSDVYAQVTMHWDLEAEVRDAQGTVLARNAIAGTSGIGATGLEASNAQGAIGMASTRFSELLGTPEMVAALQ